MQLGRPNVFSAQFYQPLDTAQRFFVAPSVLASQTLEYLYFKEQQVAQYDTRRYGASLDVGAAFAPRGEARLGLVRQGVDETQKVGVPVPLLEGGHHSLAGVSGRLSYDSVDKRLFATDGTVMHLNAYSSQPSLGADRHLPDGVVRRHDVDQPQGQRLAVRPARRVRTWAAMRRSTTSSRPAACSTSRATAHAQLVGKEYGLAVMQYRRRVGFLNETLGSAAYAGGSLEVGNVFKRLDGTPTKGALASGSLFLALDSRIGPVYLAYGRSEGGRSMLYLYLGSSLEMQQR